ncbi:MAG: hypothetical protein LBI40_03765 [Treponema sp.]|jgi:hypothetical protein|nr:hypothetical protein [Treponema sp.]
MAKAIYEQGELERVRNRLGVTNKEEAEHMAKVLGGEVGVEKQSSREAGNAKASSGKTTPKRRIETAADEKAAIAKPMTFNFSLPVIQSYAERVKMDKLAYQGEFDIKTVLQLIASVLSFAGAPKDYISHVFINRRMDEYYRKIGALVTLTRLLFPKSNVNRNEQLKKGSRFAYYVLDAIRKWNIERISSDLARMRTHSRRVTIGECKELLKAIYKPIIILERLAPEIQIKGAYNLLYKYLYLENSGKAAAYQGHIKTALAAFVGVSRDVRYLVYPLLMKLLSDKCLSYEQFFREKRANILAFLGIKEENIIDPSNTPMKVKLNGEVEVGQSEEDKKESPEKIATQKAQQAALEAEKSLVEKGLHSLENIFPKAGWEQLESYYDIYPYFAKVLDMKKGYELIAPTDPMLSFCVFVRILEELFFGLRAVKFTQILNADGSLEKAEEQVITIVNKWHDYLTDTLVKEYLERLVEYCELLASSPEARTSSFATRLADEMNLAKRMYFFPHYKHTVTSALAASALQKRVVTPIFREVRRLRKCLALFVNEIEKALSAGGAEAKVLCNGIENPWAPYVFQISNPVSKRLDVLLGPKNRNNASLVLITYAVATILDYFENNDESWAYKAPSSALFRSKDGMGAVPQFGVDTLLNADAIFKQTIKEMRAKAAQASEKQPST